MRVSEQLCQCSSNVSAVRIRTHILGSTDFWTFDRSSSLSWMSCALSIRPLCLAYQCVKTFCPISAQIKAAQYKCPVWRAQVLEQPSTNVRSEVPKPVKVFFTLRDSKIHPVISHNFRKEICFNIAYFQICQRFSAVAKPGGSDRRVDLQCGRPDLFL